MYDVMDVARLVGQSNNSARLSNQLLRRIRERIFIHIYIFLTSGALGRAARTSPLFYSEHVQRIPMICIWMLLLNAGSCCGNNARISGIKVRKKPLLNQSTKTLPVRFYFKNAFFCLVRFLKAEISQVSIFEPLHFCYISSC